MSNSKPDHNPIATGNWVPFKGFAFNDWYDLKLKSGRIIKNAKGTNRSHFVHADYPNGVQGHEVSMIRMLPDAELPDYTKKGVVRLEEHIKQHGVRFPVYIRSQDRFVHHNEVRNGEYLVPSQIAACRYRKPSGEYSDTYFIAGEGTIVYEPLNFKYVSPTGDGVWWEGSETVLSPKELAERHATLSRLDRGRSDEMIVAQKVRDTLPTLPMNLVLAFAKDLLRWEYVAVINGEVVSHQRPFELSLDDIVETKIRQYDHEIATYLETELQQKYRAVLKELAL